MPIDDLGIYIGWSSVYQATREKPRDKTVKLRSEQEQLCYDVSIEAAHTLFAHKLTTVGAPFCQLALLPTPPLNH